MQRRNLDRAKPRLVASDVDGTLLDNDEKVAPRTKAVIRSLVADGATFVLATGRPPRWIEPVVDGLGYAPMAVCGNGAVIYDSDSDRVLSSRSLDVETLAWVAELALQTIPGCGLAAERVGESAHDAATPQFVSSPGYQHAWLNPDNTETSSEEVLAAPAIKLLIRQPSATSEAMRQVLEPLVGTRADITYSTNNGLIEISAPGVTKASGLDLLAERFGIAHSEIVAFGDMPNDVPMLTLAGHGVAMGNAHADALAAADEVTASNQDCGVAVVLERWWSA
ncbi:HAD family hydrolase [Antrihabitans cavernicola]|uniref:HAD family hydrolase n=1 Tax=Antrihabitans cavernicola TaxID=2495913 RepID=A0A5A7SEZ2_9NOCA|nr:HAD family hydrolase [Spelaeibacter cavernicola]KAA0024668.1 HAD family hydrolase [Spelaeibacter cavernicola]